MNERGVDSQLIELQLSHRERNAIASIYDRSERVEERRTLMQSWADYVEELKTRPATPMEFANALGTGETVRV